MVTWFGSFRKKYRPTVMTFLERNKYYTMAAVVFTGKKIALTKLELGGCFLFRNLSVLFRLLIMSCFFQT